MISENYRHLLEKLESRTREGAVNWHATSDESEFIIYFEEFSLSIRLVSPDRHPDYYVFLLWDNSGKEIDRFAVDYEDAQGQLAADLYSAARRKALRIDEAISSIFKELEGKSVGKRGSAAEGEPVLPDDDDDIPF